MMLLGEAGASEFLIRNGLGETCDPSLGIVPVVSQDAGTNGKPGSFEVQGTAFFIGQAILLTAKHVLDAVCDERGVPNRAVGIFQFLEAGGYQMVPILRSLHVPRCDVAVALCGRVVHTETNARVENNFFKICERIPAVGSELHTFAYPKSVCSQGFPQEVNLRQSFYRGRVTEILPNGRDASMLPGPCVQTSMVIHSQASGGPVFDENGRVFAVNSTGWEGDTLSYVSTIAPILDVSIEGVLLSTAPASGASTLRQLAAAGYVALES